MDENLPQPPTRPIPDEPTGNNILPIIFTTTLILAIFVVAGYFFIYKRPNVSLENVQNQNTNLVDISTTTASQFASTTTESVVQSVATTTQKTTPKISTAPPTPTTPIKPPPLPTITEGGTNIMIGSVVTDRLETISAKSVRRPGAYSNFYFLQGIAGEQVAISLNSTQFDTHLYLTGPNGEVVAEGDDNVLSSNARIPLGSAMLKLSKTGKYTIEATSFSTNTFGGYTLSVDGSCVQPPLDVIRFDTLNYVTDPDYIGVRLLVGQMSNERLQRIGAGVNGLALPAFTDQKFCGVIDIAPGVKAEVYVPTANERAGRYDPSGPVLWDPLTRRVLADGTVVLDSFPNNIIPSSRIQTGSIFAWRLSELVDWPSDGGGPFR